MKKENRKSLLVLPVAFLFAMGVAWGGSQDGAMVGGMPLLVLLFVLILAIQWVSFIPAYLLQTEKTFDITGSLTYILAMLTAVFLTPHADSRAILLLALVVIWAVRLGTFLFRRVHKDGKDGRFDEIKPSFLRFLNVWTIQGLWVSLTLAAALTAVTSIHQKELDFFALLGFVIWLAGIGIEAAADAQKSAFRADPKNKGKFIESGLWGHSRHPNYFGEILLWIGVAVIALPTLQGLQFITLISPLFVILLLTRISGIPLLEQRADEKWGGQDDYEAYKKRVPVLIPRL